MGVFAIRGGDWLRSVRDRILIEDEDEEEDEDEHKCKGFPLMAMPRKRKEV
jgi:hypothetical protein